MSSISIIASFILIILIIGFGYGISIPQERCDAECRTDPYMLSQANISGHGINHVCYDLCYGGCSNCQRIYFFEWRLK